MNPVFLILWVLSLIPLFMVPFCISLFYHRTFKRETYPYLFALSIVMVAGYSLTFLIPSFSPGIWFFAMGGAILGGASLQLNYTMIKRRK